MQFNKIKNTPFLVILIVLISIGIGTAVAGVIPTITLDGNVVVTGESTFQNDLNFVNDLSSINFPATSFPSNPMITMFSSGTLNADRMVLGHSPGLSTWGLEYNDGEDLFIFRGNDEILLIDLNDAEMTLNGDADINGDINCEGCFGLQKPPVDILPASGGPTGAEYTIECPDGHIASGIKGKAGAGIDDMQLICKKLLRASLGPIGPVFSLNPAFSFLITNSAGGNAFELDCPSLVGSGIITSMLIRINPDSPFNIRGFSITCTDLDTGATSGLGPVGGASANTSQVNCGSNKVITGFSGTFGDSEFPNLVNSIKLHCG